MFIGALFQLDRVGTCSVSYAPLPEDAQLERSARCTVTSTCVAAIGYFAALHTDLITAVETRDYN